VKKESFQSLPNWLKSNVFYRAHLLGEYGIGGFDKTLTEVHPLDANLIGSEKANGKHILMLDLDQKSFHVASSTKGHSHVYIDADLSLSALKEIVDVLAKHGVVQQGIKAQLDASNCLTLRPPGITKGNHEDEVGIEEYKNIKLGKDNIAVNDLKLMPEINLPDHIQTKIEQWKAHLTNGLTSEDFKIFSNININKLNDTDSITISFPEEFIHQVLKVIFVKLGLDAKDGTMEINANIPLDDKTILIKANDRLIAEGKLRFDINHIVLELRKEFFYVDNFDQYLGYCPTWDKVLEVISNI
jgi:hypothetical protein